MMDFLYHCIKPRTYFNGRARLALRSWKCAGAKAHRPLKLCIGFLACGSDTPTKIIVTTQLGNDLEIASFMLLSRFSRSTERVGATPHFELAQVLGAFGGVPPCQLRPFPATPCTSTRRLPKSCVMCSGNAVPFGVTRCESYGTRAAPYLGLVSRRMKPQPDFRHL
jgi:hypothetical protein